MCIVFESLHDGDEAFVRRGVGWRDGLVGAATVPTDQNSQVGYALQHGQGGTGLGLAFVEELAEIYDWNCDVIESAAGGARFEFTNVDRDA